MIYYVAVYDIITASSYYILKRPFRSPLAKQARQPLALGKLYFNLAFIKKISCTLCFRWLLPQNIKIGLNG